VARKIEEQKQLTKALEGLLSGVARPADNASSESKRSPSLSSSSSSSSTRKRPQMDLSSYGFNPSTGSDTSNEDTIKRARSTTLVPSNTSSSLSAKISGFIDLSNDD
jgi:hypothetical protein